MNAALSSAPGMARVIDAAVATLGRGAGSGILELIGRVARHCEQTHREASLCGAMAAEPECLATLLGLGIRALSLPPGALAQTKAALARCGQP